MLLAPISFANRRSRLNGALKTSGGTLSIDNLKRDPEELERIFAIVEEKVAALGAAGERTKQRRIRAVGRLQLLPGSTQDAIARVEADTASYGPYELIIAVGYGGREEITDAVKRLVADHVSRGESLEAVAAAIEPEEISKYLYAADVPDPDLIIRPSGELRLSGFLLWQTPTASITSVTSTGRSSGRSTSSERCVLTTVASAVWAGRSPPKIVQISTTNWSSC